MGRGATFNGIMELPLSFALRALFTLASLPAGLFLSLLVYATGQIRVEKCMHTILKRTATLSLRGQFDRESSSFVLTHFLLLLLFLRLDFSLNAFHSFPRLYVTWHENETFSLSLFFDTTLNWNNHLRVYLQKYFLFSYYYYYFFFWCFFARKSS